MSGQIVVENNRLVVKQGSAASTVIMVENDTLDNIHITTPPGVAFDFNEETGEIVLIGNALGTHEVLLGWKTDKEDIVASDAIVLVVEADDEGTIPSPEEAKEKETAVTEETPAPVVEEPVTPPVVETPPPVVETPPPAPTAPMNTQPAPVVTQEAPVVQHAANVADLMRSLEEYKSKMGLRCLVTTDLGVNQQQKLFKALVKVLNKDGKDFTDNMNALLKFVKDNRSDVFHERAINRFIPQVKMNKEEIQLFTRLTAMLIVTADVEDKKLVSQRIDFKYIEQRLKNGKAMSQLINYFNPTRE